jgi:hypothetical protein
MELWKGDAGSMSLRNVGTRLSRYMVSLPTKPQYVSLRSAKQRKLCVLDIMYVD